MDALPAGIEAGSAEPRLNASALVGATPPPPVRKVSLAVRDFLRERRDDLDGYGVALAVSGGADSLAMAVAATDAAARLGIPLTALVVDHGMRPGSAEEAVSVQGLLTSLGVPDARVLTDRAHSGVGEGTAGPDGRREMGARSPGEDRPVGSGTRRPMDEGAGRPGGNRLVQPGTRRSTDEGEATLGAHRETGLPNRGLETQAREIRHALLEQASRTWATERNLQHVDILLGHTMDDQAETVLMRLGRGASPRALAAMRPVTAAGADSLPVLYRARPMLELRRRDTEAFCTALGLQPVYDPTNVADGPWRTRAGQALPRAAIRERALPALAGALGQDPVPALARVAQLLAEDSAALDRFAAEVAVAVEVAPQSASAVPTKTSAGVGMHEQPLPAATGALDSQRLRRQPVAIRKRVLMNAAETAGAAGPTQEHAEQLDALLFSATNAAGAPRTVQLPGGVTAHRKGDLVVFSPDGR